MKHVINIDDDAEVFKGRLDEIKKLYNLGIDYTLFWNLMHNLHNGSSTHNRFNCFEISGWVAFYASYKIEISSGQLENVFEYVRNHYSAILRKSAKMEYSELLSNNITEEENPFVLEMIVLKTLAT